MKQRCWCISEESSSI